ncbi:MAG TPA: type II toxin-antitoxin system RelE/ParE family toxin [Armatimonadota bacterium]|jgi:mRNA-degrading endonuclease RelE of RelBE toxin-antitoxin system
MPWTLRFARRAQKDIASLLPEDRAAVQRALARLADDPGSVDLRKLAGRSDEWRMRVGMWRVRLVVHSDLGVLEVSRVLRRDDNTYRS